VVASRDPALKGSIEEQELPVLGQRLRDAFDLLAAPAPVYPDRLAPDYVHGHPRLAGAAVAGLIAVAYCLLLNAYWHFSTDSALYLTLGRNLLAGRGYVFNGIPHRQVPGGWPWTLAALLWVSPSFLWLNTAQTAIGLAALAVLFLVLRQVLRPGDALLIVLMTAFSLWVYEYSMALMSEMPFFLLSNITVLLLLKATRADSAGRRGVLVAGVCAGLVVAFLFRLLALFWLGPFALALLLENRAARPLPGRLAAAALVVVTLVGCFFAYTHWSRSVKEPTAQERATADEPPAAKALRHGGDTHYDVPTADLRGHYRRLKALVFWPTWILWPPTGVLQVTKVQRLFWLACWLPNLVVLLGCYRAARRGQILVATSLLFLAPFVLWSPGLKATTGRYGISVVPFVMLLFLMGLRQAGELLRARLHMRVGPRLLVGLGIAAILLPSLVLFSVDVWVQRAADYYAVYRGGGYAGLMGDLKWLRDHHIEGPVASKDYVCMRAVASLTDIPVARIDTSLVPVSPGFEGKVKAFAAEAQIPYLLTMDEYRERAWPVWHIPRDRLRGKPLPADFWQLWRYDAATDELKRIPVEPLHKWPKEFPLSRSDGR
jgi:hypothetical protein